MNMKVVIIGGGSAGTTCAFELRKLNKDVEVIIVEKSNYTEYSPCALPYVLSGEIKSFNDVFIFTKHDYTDNKIRLMLNSEVKSIERENKKIVLKDGSKLNYDVLVLSTGGACFVPPIKGINNADFKVLKTIDDAKAIKKSLLGSKNIIIIGAGMIGIELAASLIQKGKKIAILEACGSILPNLFDEDMSEILEDYLSSKHIIIRTGANITSVSKNKIFLIDDDIVYDQLVLCTGIIPNTKLAKDSGLEVDRGIVVNEFLQTSDKSIFACGDCVESYEYTSGKKLISQLGTTAVRQAKIIAKNILSKKDKFPRVLNNTVSKIGDLYFGSVGLKKRRAEELGLKVVSAKYTGNLRAEYYPSKENITIKLVCLDSGVIIGGQIIGHNEVIGRLDMLALAIQKKMNVKDIANLETAYNPASAPIFDPINIVASICQKKLDMMVSK